MKKKLSLILCFMLLISVLAGCGSSESNLGEDDPVVVDVADVTDDVEGVVATVGPDDGTHFEFWAFVELHNTFYASMLDKWNEENPDRPIQITFTTYPYTDMHNKLMMANQTGTGAPDFCDVEIGQFPNFLQGEVQFHPLNDAIAPYQDDLVQARLDIYSKDGNYYGAPTHVGATVMYYNIDVLESYGIDYTTIQTWDDFTRAGEALHEASDGEVYMTSVDTGGVDLIWISMAAHGEDWTGGQAGEPNVELPSVKRMLKMQQEWLESGVAMISPGGHVDREEGYQNLIDGKMVAFPKAMWFMSRFLNYMPEMEGQWAIAPVPVFEIGQNRSVGIGGTGTIVSKQSKNPELAAEFLAYAKLSYEANVGIWEVLGFDTCNTTIWTDPEITTDTSNKYIKYFATNPFDTLNEIRDEIGKIEVVAISPVINTQMSTVTLNDIFENGMDVDEALAEAQEVILFEQ